MSPRDIRRAAAPSNRSRSDVAGASPRHHFTHGRRIAKRQAEL